MVMIQVLGTGCSKCGYLAQHAEQAIREMGREEVVEKVTDIMQMLAFNPPALPALAINGKIVSAGTLPSAEQIKGFLNASIGKAGV